MSVGRIAIVGAGLSGTLTTVQLLRRAARPIEIVLIESRPTMGRGAAYGTTSIHHLLNVPAGRMSALPDDATHFLNWARRRDPGIDAKSFVPRLVYGDYLGELLSESESAARAGVRLTRVRERVWSVDAGPPVELRLAGGAAIGADLIVFALGNFPPTGIAAAERDLGDDRRYIRDPWTGAELPVIGRDAGVMLIGTGLTAIDMVAGLDASGHRGSITAVSRHGLLPAVHADVGAAGIDIGIRAGVAVQKVLRRLRQASRTQPWRQLVDGLRGETSAIWQSWSRPDRARFLRHVRQYWEVHRHRIAPDVGASVSRLIAERRLTIVAGSLARFRANGGQIEAEVRRRGQGDTTLLRAAYVLNCTGPSCDYGRIDDPLVRSMLAGGIARPDELRLGLETADDGGLIGTDGRASARFFTLGPPSKPRLWETTAAPEIRVQAVSLAERLLAGDQI